MGTELAVSPKQERDRFSHVPGRLIDFAAMNRIARMDDDDEHGNGRMMEEIQARAHELAGPSPSPLLQSIGLTVALCEHDVRARQSVDGPLSNVGTRLRNLDRSMRRYLAACRMLALVQRLNLPSIQVNVATNQVVSNV